MHASMHALQNHKGLFISEYLMRGEVGADEGQT